MPQPLPRAHVRIGTPKSQKPGFPSWRVPIFNKIEKIDTHYQGKPGFWDFGVPKSASNRARRTSSCIVAWTGFARAPLSLFWYMTCHDPWHAMTWHDMTEHVMTGHHMTRTCPIMTWQGMSSHDMTRLMTCHFMSWHDMTWHDMTHTMTWHDIGSAGLLTSPALHTWLLTIRSAAHEMWRWRVRNRGKSL